MHAGADYDNTTGAFTDIVVRGFRDFSDDGDQSVDIFVGPCESTDGRFAIAEDQRPDDTRRTLVNRHVPFPVIKEVMPGIVHISGGTVTVRGVRFAHNSTVMYGETVVSDWDEPEPKPYTWRYYNTTGRSFPLRLHEADIFDRLLNSRLESVMVDANISEMLGNFSLLGSEVNAETLLLEIVAAGKLNRTLCDVLEQETGRYIVMVYIVMCWNRRSAGIDRSKNSERHC